MKPRLGAEGRGGERRVGGTQRTVVQANLETIRYRPVARSFQYGQDILNKEHKVYSSLLYIQKIFCHFLTLQAMLTTFQILYIATAQRLSDPGMITQQT